jgi:hypothetical protein
MSKVLVFVVLICLLLAFILGAVLFSRPGDDHTWRDEQLDQVAVESAWQWARLKLYAGYLLAGLTIALVTGAGMGLSDVAEQKGHYHQPDTGRLPAHCQAVGAALAE